MEKELFVEIGIGQQAGVLRKIKQHSNLTWREMAGFLEVNRSMIFQYLRETSRMRTSRLRALCSETGFDDKFIENLTLVEVKYSDKKKILTPKLDESLAEFLGALSGDGNIYAKNYAVTITCGAVADNVYVNTVIKQKFSDLFGLQPSIRIANGAIQCKTYSKELVEFLTEEFNFPVGERKNKTFIPKSLFDDKVLLCAFLRGLFDTDGSFHRKRENSAVIEYISCSPAFLKQIKEALISLGFKATLSGKSVYIYDQSQVDTFFKVIKPSNIKHSLKHQIFRETGKVPLHKETMNKLELLKNNA